MFHLVKSRSKCFILTHLMIRNLSPEEIYSIYENPSLEINQPHWFINFYSSSGNIGNVLMIFCIVFFPHHIFVIGICK